MKCNKHDDLSVKFLCHLCKKPLCEKCSPVSFQGNIYCEECLEKVEEDYYRSSEKKRGSLGKIIKILLVIFLAGSLLGGGVFLFFKKRAKVELDVGGKEKAQYHLSMALEAESNKALYDRHLKNLKRLGPKYRNLASTLNRGVVDLKMGRYLKAEESFQKIKMVLPDWDWPYLLIGRARFGKGDLVNAITEIKNGLEYHPEGIIGYVLLAEIYETQEELDQALVHYRRASFNSKEKDPELLVKIGLVYGKKKRLSKAREFRQKARRLGGKTKELDELIQELVS